MGRARTIARLSLTAALALVVALLAVPIVRSSAEYRDNREALFSDDATSRSQAIVYFSRPIDPENPLSRPRFFAIEGLEARMGDASGAVLDDLHSAFGGSRAFAQRFPSAHLRAVLRKLEASDEAESARYALSQVAGATGDAPEALIIEIFDRLASHGSGEIRRAALEHACWRLGEGAVPLVERGLRDDDASVRRFARLSSVHLGIEIDGAFSGGLAEAYARALRASSDEPIGGTIIEEYEAYTLEELRAMERGAEAVEERARVRLAITSREPSDRGVDEALILARDGVLAARDVYVALLHAGRAREVMRAMLDSGDESGGLVGEHRAILARFFDPREFSIPVPSEIPRRSACAANGARRAARVVDVHRQSCVVRCVLTRVCAGMMRRKKAPRMRGAFVARPFG